MKRTIPRCTSRLRFARHAFRRVPPVIRFGPLIAVVAVAACSELIAPDRQDAVRTDANPSSLHPFTPVQSVGVYRIPYSDGTNMTVSNDHHDHSPFDRIDMSAGAGAPIVAAAGGWIRAIIDNNGRFPNPGNGVDVNNAPQADSLEHSCGNNDSTATVVGTCALYNNYVWIEHPNGEFTKYTHFGTGTVQLPPPAGSGLVVGQWVDAGQILGLEGDVGQATNPGGAAFHLHFEVAFSAGAPLDWDSLGGGINNGVNLVPVVCDIPANTWISDSSYTANPCMNVSPVADAGGPYSVDEGAALMLDSGGSTDPDGNVLSYRWTNGANLNDSTIAQPTFLGGDDTVIPMQLTVYDQVEALDASDNTTITVNNADPIVTIDPAQTTTIDEGGLVTVMAEFTDAGWLDTHAVSIDWGVPAGQQGNLLSAPAIQILDAGGPGTPLRGRVLATYEYGDNDAGEGYTIEVTVTDDDDGAGSASFALTVENLDPEAAIDPAGAVLVNGVPTIVANAGDEIDFASQTEDAGSDDLTLTWDWDDGSSAGRVSLVNPPAPDPLPSPTMQARSDADARTHVFADACMYDVSFTAADDDGGSSIRNLAVLIAGNADMARSSGYWSAEYRQIRRSDFTTATLQCYLQIVAHASSVFTEERALSTFSDAADILKTSGSSVADDILDVQLLALWLNFANGAYSLDDMVDGTGDGIADMTLHELLQNAENLRTHPNRTRDDVLAMKVVLDALNTEK